MNLSNLAFRHALRLTEADRRNPKKILVRYQVVDSSTFDHSLGVYIVSLNSEVIYIGSYRNGFRKRWLYAREQYLYHFKYIFIADALDTGAKVEVFTESEESLKEQLGSADDPWVTAIGIEDRLIRDYQPRWNCIGVDRS